MTDYYGTSGANTLGGSVFADSVYGYGGDETLYGGNVLGLSGSDSLYAGSGDDYYAAIPVTTISTAATAMTVPMAAAEPTGSSAEHNPIPFMREMATIGLKPWWI